MNLSWIGKDHGFSGRNVCVDVNCCGDRRTDESQCLVDQRGNPDGQSALVSFSTEDQDLLHQVAGPDSCLMDTGQETGYP